MATRVNVDLPEALKTRLDTEAQRQKRSQRAIVEIALERYFEEIGDKAFPLHARRSRLRRSP